VTPPPKATVTGGPETNGPEKSNARRQGGRTADLPRLVPATPIWILKSTLQIGSSDSKNRDDGAKKEKKEQDRPVGRRETKRREEKERIGNRAFIGSLGVDIGVL